MYYKNNSVIYVNTAELKVAEGDSIIESGPLGTCIAICFYDKLLNLLVMAHILLPKAYKKDISLKDQNKYADMAFMNAIDLLFSKNSELENVACFYAGGSNVLKRANETIDLENIKAVEYLIKKYKIPVLFKSTGGTNRRIIRVDLSKKLVSVTEGTNKNNIIFKLNNIKNCRII